MYFCNFVIISQCKKVWPLNKLKFSLPRDAFCQDWMKLANWFYNRIFSNFGYFVIISPLEKYMVLHWINLYTHYPRMLCAKFGWNWPTGSVEDDFKMLSTYFHYFVRRGPSFEQAWIPLTQRRFMPNLVEICPVVHLKIRQYIFAISSVNISPWKRAEPFIWTNLNPLHPRMIYAKFGLKLAKWFWRGRYFKFLNVFSLSWHYLLLEQGGPLHLKKIKSLSSMAALG